MLQDYLIGLDLGQQNDYTVLTVLGVDKKKNIYTLPYAKRYPLRTDYTVIVDSVNHFMNRSELFNASTLIVDYTGVGHPVVDLFRKSRIDPVAINITGGSKSNWVNRQNVNVPKKEIVSCLQVVFQCNRLKIASELKLLPEIKKELMMFTARTSSRGQSTYEAASGAHDDIVMSLGLAIWYGEYKTRPGNNVRLVGGN